MTNVDKIYINLLYKYINTKTYTHLCTKKNSDF